MITLRFHFWNILHVIRGIWLTKIFAYSVNAHIELFLESVFVLSHNPVHPEDDPSLQSSNWTCPLNWQKGHQTQTWTTEICSGRKCLFGTRSSRWLERVVLHNCQHWLSYEIYNHSLGLKAINLTPSAILQNCFHRTQIWYWQLTWKRMSNVPWIVFKLSLEGFIHHG